MRRTNRTGAMGMLALVCVAVAALSLLLLLREAVTRARTHRAAEYQLQADWLAEAGIERGLRRLSEDASFAGETWRLEPDALDGQHSAEVEITVRPAEQGQEVVSVARFHAGPVYGGERLPLIAERTRTATTRKETP